MEQVLLPRHGGQFLQLQPALKSAIKARHQRNYRPNPAWQQFLSMVFENVSERNAHAKSLVETIEDLVLHHAGTPGRGTVEDDRAIYDKLHEFYHSKIATGTNERRQSVGARCGGDCCGNNKSKKMEQIAWRCKELKKLLPATFRPRSMLDVSVGS